LRRRLDGGGGGGASVFTELALLPDRSGEQLAASKLREWAQDNGDAPAAP
jgi:hypothetical protein